MKSIVTRKYLIPFALVASLFFCWGFAHSILDVLNKHFQNMLEISKTRSALVQAMVYGGYFIMAIPAGVIIRKWGYKGRCNNRTYTIWNRGTPLCAGRTDDVI